MQQTFQVNLMNISDKKHETRETFQRIFHPPKKKSKSGEYFYPKHVFFEKQRKIINIEFNVKKKMKGKNIFCS